MTFPADCKPTTDESAECAVCGKSIATLKREHPNFTPPSDGPAKCCVCGLTAEEIKDRLSVSDRKIVSQQRYASLNGYWMIGVTYDDGSHATFTEIDDDGNPVPCTLADLKAQDEEDAP